MSPINIQAYVPTAAYWSMVDRIIAAPSAPGLCLHSKLIEILGDAGVWPISCLEDRLEERQRRRKRGLND